MALTITGADHKLVLVAADKPEENSSSEDIIKAPARNSALHAETPIATKRKIGINIDEGPQVKIMKEQVDAVREQVASFKNIERHMETLVEIEQQKLSVMQGNQAKLKIN